jgi:hypothetical protein
MAVTRTPTVPNPGGVSLDVAAGDRLFFTLDADGPIASFTFASSVRQLLHDAPGFPGHPKARYEWDCKGADLTQLELLDLNLVFLTNARYRYFVERRRPGAPGFTVLDVRYAGDPTDKTSESITVAIQ